MTLNDEMTIPSLYSIFQQHPKVSTDSRQLPPGCIFFALKGSNFDGNEFAIYALENGAAYSVIDNPIYQTDKRCLLVPDVLESLQQLANHHRRQFEIPVIGIGGSNGKTTTKELISAVLSAHYPCHFTKGNLNNHIGVPLTLLSMPRGTEVANTGGTIIITKRGKPVARLVPVTEQRPQALGCLEGAVAIVDEDFSLPAWTVSPRKGKR